MAERYPPATGRHTTAWTPGRRRVRCREVLLGAGPRGSGQAMARSFAREELAETGAAGEYFEYRVGTPVSLKRGTAAMVPPRGGRAR